MAKREDIILKYADKRLQRYTSYPTAPNFSPSVTAADYETWLAALNPDEPISLYLHVPFCRDMCWYCGCNTKATRRTEPVDQFADSLLAEIDLIASLLPAQMKVSHVHWGGGSPTYLAPTRFTQLMDRLRARFDVTKDAEIAIEIDPRHMTPALAETYRAAGVTRASLGVQTFEPRVQAAINRLQDTEMVGGAVDLLRAAGVAGLNFDLIYGLPFQTVDNCRASVREALRFSPDRLSVFGYAHVPHFKPHQKLIRDADLPDASARLAQAIAIAEELETAGYVSIGLDHYAKANDSLAVAHARKRLHRNFQGYTTDNASAILGFGPSAIGWLPQGYVQNTTATAEWERRVLAGETPIARGCALTAQDRFRRDIIETLMCHLEADVAAISAKHGLAAPEPDLSSFLNEGIVAKENSTVRVHEDYRPLVRNVAAAFDAYLPASTAKHSVAV